MTGQKKATLGGSAALLLGRLFNRPPLHGFVWYLAEVPHPEHAAVMIAEAVVEDPGSYPDCGRYLGDLFGGSKGSAKSLDSALNSTNSSNSNSFNSSNSSDDDRYSY